MEIDLVGIIGLLIVVLLWLILYRLHHDRRTAFDLTDVLMENGRVSRQALIEVGAFLATTWVLIHQEFKNVVTDWYVLAYGSFWILKGAMRVWKTPGVQLGNGNGNGHPNGEAPK